MVFTGLFLPLLLVLGFWQLDRAGEKETQLQRWQQQSGDLSWQQQLEAGLETGKPVELVGRYSGRVHWLLDNRTRDGRAGYEVLSLFYPSEGRPVVVNRGWLAAPRKREDLPAIPTPGGPVSLAGRVGDFPEPPVLADLTPGSGWPRRVQALSPDQAATVEPALADHLIRLAGPEQPGAFRADWAPDLMGPQTHYGYAVQWFSLALALIVLTAVASYRKTDTGHDDRYGR